MQAPQLLIRRAYLSALTLVPLVATATSAQTLVINNGLAPPVAENVLDVPNSSMLHVVVDNEGCDATVEHPCVSPGDPTAVGGTAQTIEIFTTSMFDGFVGREITARDSSTVVVRRGFGPVPDTIHAYGESNVTIEGLEGERDGFVFAYDDATVTVSAGACHWCRVRASGSSYVFADGYGYSNVSASEQAHVVFSAKTDDGGVSVTDDALLECYGDPESLSVEGRGRAVMYPGCSVERLLRVREAGLLERLGGDSGQGSPDHIGATMIMSGGSIGSCGFEVSGFASISGGSIYRSSGTEYRQCLLRPTDEQPGQWNFVARDNGWIHLSGGSLQETVGLAARGDSWIRIFGSDFEVDGIPARYGYVSQQTGVLTGTLASGEPINNRFAQKGGGCGDVACTGRMILLPARYAEPADEKALALRGPNQGLASDSAKK